ncbi:MAG: glycosyltransferase, partial [Actinomycetota bacterium]|nr:glycosyltransferase [Actinomycetota bacterium]
MTLMMRMKRLLRPLIPDRVMARYRVSQHSRQVRTNVDAVIDDGQVARRWLAATPDTYRVRSSRSLPRGEVSDLDIFGDDSYAGSAAHLLNDHAIGVGVVAEVEPPRLVKRRRVEPVIAPVTIAARPDVVSDVGGPPSGDLAGYLARLRDAGHRIGLAPLVPTGAEVSRRDPIAAESVVILSAVPIHDIGGGGRGAQLALEMLREGFHVTFVSAFGSAASHDVGVRIVHPRLEQARSDQFLPGAFAVRSAQPAFVLVEAPVGVLVDHAAALRSLGWDTVYDLNDDWTAPALGGDWYTASIEDTLIHAADLTVATSRDLATNLRRAGRDPVIIPNAVNDTIFGRDGAPRPTEFEDGTVIGYHGSLYGDWFDWGALSHVAETYPAAMIVVIGDDKTSRSPMPANVRFLGLMPLTELPPYLQHFDVGLVPFKVSDETHAVSPLKVYEYLASGVPVAAPPLRELEGMDGVFTDIDLAAAVGRALGSPPPDRST